MSSDDGTTRDGAAAPAERPIEGVVVRPGQQLPNDPAAIEALIAERRANLAATVDELVVRAHPKEIARRSADDARARVRAFAYAANGEPRVERISAVAAAAGAFVVLLLLVRRRRGRAR